jgi:hypothetical protein
VDLDSFITSVTRLQRFCLINSSFPSELFPKLTISICNHLKSKSQTFSSLTNSNTMSAIEAMSSTVEQSICPKALICSKTQEQLSCTRSTNGLAIIAPRLASQVNSDVAKPVQSAKSVANIIDKAIATLTDNDFSCSDTEAEDDISSASEGTGPFWREVAMDVPAKSFSFDYLDDIPVERKRDVAMESPAQPSRSVVSINADDVEVTPFWRDVAIDSPPQTGKPTVSVGDDAAPFWRM